ncbi:alpha/beta fold hydrolase [Terribacillus saccharophilus]|uniref:Alpha/beta hydrolase n=1 Tax=Terribacillus saccharophilus TaxID=361277 RepID=A0ABX4H2R9_9BACI|nr:alpha/beta hydrolase [Terribacillus saccharophilus]PAD37136.1 alpha/beta hydrolase [Terribacillus saccharophilus]PAD97380.1 alpha/beta hydrolase [Terribacillus saccharophilus]PAE01428.1 alpha/beta hydrolase [Terribacillus saccharophilus]
MNHLKSDDPKSMYFQSYDRVLNALWPTKFSSYFLETTYGKTYIIESGDLLSPPLILLHGAKMSSTMWYPNVAEWSKQYRVICVDIVGDKNKSILEKQFLDRLSYATWLNELLESLQIDKTNIVGISYGALHTVNFLTFFPHKVNKAVIMSPAATYIPFNREFYTYAMGLVSNEVGVKNFLKWIFNDRHTVNSHIEQQLIAGMQWKTEAPTQKATQAKQAFPYIFMDDELAEIQTQLLLLLGEKEVMYDPLEAYNRAKNSSPHITVEIIKGVGHLLSMEKPVQVNKRVLSFSNN